MPVGQQRKGAAALGFGVVQNDGSRIGDSAEGCGHDSLCLGNFGGSQTVIQLPLEAGGRAT